MYQTFYLGGYTRRLNTGIAQVRFDNTAGTFDTSQHIAELTQPTYLTLSRDGNYLFSLHKSSTLAGVVAFKKIDNQWVKVSECFDSNGVGCHICYCDEHRTLYVSNYHEGALNVYAFHSDETLHPVQRIEHIGSSTHPNQQSAHIHFAGLSHDNAQLFVCDLGSDTVSTYNIATDGSLTLAHTWVAPSGSGPRHLVLHPTLPIVYVIAELSNQTFALTLDDSGNLTLVQTIDNVPQIHANTSAGAAIRISYDGKFLYTSTRFHNVITVFQIQSDGTLSLIQTIDTNGKIPRDFTLDNRQKWLVVAHQDSDYVTVFKRDAATGLLELMAATTFAPECVCIVGQ